MADTEHGSDAQLSKDYGDLTPKQRRVVDEIVESRGTDYTKANIARDAGCRGSYVTYVEDNFPHVIEERRSNMRVPITDGEGSYAVELGATDWFKVMRSLPPELAEKVYDQIRSRERPDGGHQEFTDYDGSD